MRVAVVTNQVPFVRGGAEALAEWLCSKLEEHGHQAQLVRIPFMWSPAPKVLEHALAARLIRLRGVDRVVAMKFPAYFVPHDDKVLWLLHQFRQAYDLWGTTYQDIPDTAAGRGIRDAIVAADNAWLPEAKRIYTNSQVTKDRLRRFNDLDSEVLYPPLLDPASFRSGDYGDYVFCPGRITAGKRQHLLVEALALTRTQVKVRIAGAPERAEDLERLEQLAAKHGVGHRLELVPRFITEEEKRTWMAGALACAYLPYDEDSYGYVTLEGFESRRPVITCTDSGGILELVRDGTTGIAAEPEPAALAIAMDDLMADRAAAKRLGEAGFGLARSLGIGWDRVIEKLTA
jgi:glycosyltransferase involved in cell wall biosynthesis